MSPETGQTLWVMLHSYAYHYPAAADPARQTEARAWLADFTARVAVLSSGCRCADHWGALCQLVQPPLAGRESFYWWTVAIHDAVNARLFKPLHAADWSRAFWAPLGFTLP